MGRAMRVSGIEWIGEIPQEWEINKLKYIAEFKNGKAHEQSMDVEGKYTVVNSKFVSTEGAVRFYCNEQIMPLAKDDVCIVLSDVPNGRAYAKCYIIECDDAYTLNQRVGGFSKISINLRYFFYNLNRNYGLLLYNDGINQTNLRKPDLLNLAFLIPPKEEQQKIADFLDCKCGLIDNTIEKQKLVIEKLKLYKQSIITEAVTKGLDPTVKMKPSGIEWIGDIPEDWDVRKLGAVASVQTGPFGSQLHNEDYVDEGTPIITVEHFGEMSIIHNNLPRVSDEDVARLSKYTLITGDLVFSRVGSVDRSVLVRETENGWLFSGRCLRVRFDSCIVSQYMNYCFCKLSFKQHMGLVAVGSTMPSINTTILSNIRIAFPSVSEQQQIADYLDKKCFHIDSLITQKGQLLRKLYAYKKSLIYECVTGKKEVG